jgi:hypothetical protein
MLVNPSTYWYLMPLNNNFSKEYIDELATDGKFPIIEEILYPSLGVALFFGILRAILTRIAFRVRFLRISTYFYVDYNLLMINECDLGANLVFLASESPLYSLT